MSHTHNKNLTTLTAEQQQSILIGVGFYSNEQHITFNPIAHRDETAMIVVKAVKGVRETQTIIMFEGYSIENREHTLTTVEIIHGATSKIQRQFNSREAMLSAVIDLTNVAMTQIRSCYI